MRHRKLGAKLGRSSPHRRAMFRNLVTSLLDHERVETTSPKAREVRRLAERMITLGKRGTLDARRRALRVVRSKQVTAKLFDDLAERYRERAGGYTRVVKTRVRRGDAAALAIVELVEGQAAAPEPEKKGRRKKGAADKPAARAGARKSGEAAPAGRGRRARGAVEAGDEKKKTSGGARRGARAKTSTKEEPAARSRRGGSGRKKSS